MKITTKIINTNTAKRTKERRVEDLLTLNIADSILKEKRGYIIKMPKSGEPVVACLSGGLDSVCNLEVLMGEFGLSVYPYFLNRNQSNYKYEKKSVRFYTNYYKKRYPNLMHDPIEITIDTPGKSYKNMLRSCKKMTDKPLYRHDVAYPARNPIIFLTGMDYAYSLQSKRIFPKTIFGAYMESDNLYHSSLTLTRLLNLVMCHAIGDWDFQFTSIPIEREFDNCYDKDVYVKYCSEKGVPLEYSRSCCLEDEIQCGACPACWDRRNAFKVNNLKDRTIYQSPMSKKPPYPVV